jgi:hypothetical protein
MENELVSKFLGFFYNREQLSIRENIFESKDLLSIDLDKALEYSGIANNINFFPSSTKGGCHKTAMFVSFSKSPKGFKLKRNNCLPLDVVLKKMVKQVLGSCYGKNQEIILLTDEMSISKSEEWHANLRTMQKVCKSIGVYYVFPDGKHENVDRFFGL